MTLKNNRAPLLSNIKLCASSHHHMWIQTGVTCTVRKRLSWVLTSVTLTFDLWPWHFSWTSLQSLVITPENFVMKRWWEHSQKAKNVIYKHMLPNRHSSTPWGRYGNHRGDHFDEMRNAHAEGVTKAPLITSSVSDFFNLIQLSITPAEFGSSSTGISADLWALVINK